MTRTYLVHAEKFGVLRKAADSIAEARAWAKTALGVGPRAVSREIAYRICGACDSKPCACGAAR